MHENTDKHKIQMDALHYWDINEATAIGALLADVPLRQDKYKKWFLPEYNTSGKTFKDNLKLMTDKFGIPKTVYLKNFR
jgi:hypothetical protein